MHILKTYISLTFDCLGGDGCLEKKNDPIRRCGSSFASLLTHITQSLILMKS